MLIVEMHRIPKPADGYDLFDCPGPLWDALRKLAVSYGWKPAGTLPASYHSAEKAKAEELKLAELRANVPPNLEKLVQKEREEARKNKKLLYSSDYWKYDQLDLYLPRDWGGIPRMVTVDDGMAWAEALDRALQHMEALGATLKIVPSEGGGMTAKLTRTMIEEARVISQTHGSFWTDQFNNRDQVKAYHAMAEEIWAQTEGKVDAFVQSVGTGGSLRGNAEGLRRRHPKVRIAAVEPSESAVLSGRPSGSHKIDGVGAGFVVPNWEPSLVDQIETVSTSEARAMAARLAREEGIFGGTSTGGNVVAALKVAEQLGADATVVTVMCDTGMKYFSKEG